MTRILIEEARRKALAKWWKKRHDAGPLRRFYLVFFRVEEQETLS